MQTIELTDTTELIANYAAMAQATLLLTAAEVAARVRPYMANRVIPALPDPTFSVGEAGIYLSHGYWRVSFHPSYDPKKAVSYRRSVCRSHGETKHSRIVCS